MYREHVSVLASVLPSASFAHVWAGFRPFRCPYSHPTPRIELQLAGCSGVTPPGPLVCLVRAGAAAGEGGAVSQTARHTPGPRRSRDGASERPGGRADRQNGMRNQVASVL